MRRALVSALLALGASLCAAPASAWDDTPAALAAKVGAAKAPGCDLCHAAAKAPVGAASQPFAKAMVARGLDADGAAALDAALAKMRADKVDSDGDGAEDLDEVAWGTDPNHGDVPQSQGEAPSYGCAAREPTGGAPGALGLALAAAVAATLARRARRRP